MSNQFITNSDMYQVNAERDITVILSRFNTEFIYDCINSALESKHNAQFIMPNPNLVRSLEDNFIIMQQNYPDDKMNILKCREETYNEIIQFVCSKFNLKFNENDQVDLYSAAYYLYEFLVSNYLQNLAFFYSKFIINEKQNLYKSLNLERFKKSSNINYGKKMSKDPVTSTILIQISYIIDQLMSFDFHFDTIVRTVYNNNNIAHFILSLFEDDDYFYDFFKKDITNSFIRPNIITNIRLLIQDTLMPVDTETFIKEG